MREFAGRIRGSARSGATRQTPCIKSPLDQAHRGIGRSRGNKATPSGGAHARLD